MMSFHDRFERDPKVCGGQTVFRGTRVILRTVLLSLAEGDSENEILRSFPALTAEDVRAAIAFAAASAAEDVPLPPLPDYARTVATSSEVSSRK